LSYAEAQRVWREVDQLPAFEHAWLWDHMVPLRGDIRADALEAWTLLAHSPPRRPGCASA